MADAVPAAAPARLDRIAGYFTQVFAVADTEARKLRHDPSELMTRALQPAIWLLLFGQVMAQVRGLGPQHGRYIDFLAPGILAQSVLFSAIFYGIAAIWERDLGVLHRYMASPAPRTALVLGKAMSSGVRGLSQAVIVYLLAIAMGIDISFSPVNILGVAAMIVVGRVRSMAISRTSRPSAASFPAASSPSVWLRAPSRTVQPDAASWRATSNPMPLFAPVTSAIFFVVVGILVSL